MTNTDTLLITRLKEAQAALIAATPHAHELRRNGRINFNLFSLVGNLRIDIRRAVTMAEEQNERLP